MAVTKLGLGLVTLALVAACGTTTPLVSTATTDQRGPDGVGAEIGQGGQVLTPGSGPAGLTPGADGGQGGSTGVRVAGTTGGTGAQLPPGGQGGKAANRRPITVGFIAADYGALLATVGASSSSSDPHAVNKALVRALNENGGLAERRIKGVYYTVEGSSADYSSDEQAACAAFTEDNKAEVVIGAGTGSQTLYGCLLKKGVPFITGNPTEGTDSVELRQYPNVFNVPGMATDRQAAALIDQSVRTGWLSKKNKLGVLRSGCPWGQRTYDGVVLPRVRRLGIAVEQFSSGCPRPGAGSVPETSNAVQSAALQFRGAGVDRVMILAGHGDAATYLLFANNADSQRWYPGYIVGTNAVAQAWAQQGVVSREQAGNTHGAGWIPVVDAIDPPQTPQMKACTALAKAGGAPPEQVPGQFGLICDAFWALRDALLRNGGQGFLALRPALEGLGTSYLSAGALGGATRLSVTKHDGAEKVAPFAYVAGCSCFRYQASPQPVT
jgi:hypothetical protein